MRNLFMTETRNTYLAITRAKLGFVTAIFSLLRNFLLTSFPIGVRAGGARGAEASPNFTQLRLFRQQEKIWVEPVFKEINIFYFNLKKILTLA